MNSPCKQSPLQGVHRLWSMGGLGNVVTELNFVMKMRHFNHVVKIIIIVILIRLCLLKNDPISPWLRLPPEKFSSKMG
jgi:hypothetical protein